MVFLCLEDKGDEKQRATRRERKSTETYQARKRERLQMDGMQA
jgi:hypothetical protein